MRNKSLMFIVLACVCALMLSSAKPLLAVEETGGLGLKVSQLYNYSKRAKDKRGSIVVLDVFKGSPAQRHGIQKGDLILKVNGVVTKQNDFKTILNDHLRGPSFSDVTLIIWRPSIQEQFEITLQRAPMAY